MLADLHLHTTASDGTWTPEELVEEARKAGLSAIAISDHDTTQGIHDAKRVAPPDLQVIPGIELSTSTVEGEEVHILGLWINPGYEPLQQTLADLREERVSRVHAIIERLASLEIHLEYEDILKFAHEDVVSRSHIAAAMVEKGVVGSKQEAFERYIGQGQPAYVMRHKLTLEEAVRLILESGGVPVLAHPGLLKDLSILPQLIQAGLVGIEVVHHSHSKEQTNRFMQVAKEHGLLPSGGSDCHGPGGKDAIYLGRYSIPWQWMEELASRRK